MARDTAGAARSRSRIDGGRKAIPASGRPIPSVTGLAGAVMSKRSHRLLSAIAALLALCGTPVSAGMRAQPMSYDLSPSGDGAEQDIRVENTGEKPLPVEMRVERRQILPDGTEKRTPAEDDFLVFPPQGIVPANGFQTFRVRYIGDPGIAQTRLYLVTVAQVPVSAAAGQTTGLQFLFNLGTLAAVSPPNSQANIVVSAVRPATAPGKLQIEVRNDGNRYARLRLGTWTLTGRDGKVEKLAGMALIKAIVQPLIEPGTTRVIELPVSAGFQREGAKASFELTAPAR